MKPNSLRLDDSSPPNMSQTTSSHSALSPLKRFGRAKGKINSIYEDILSYGCDVTKFLHSFKDTEGMEKGGDSLQIVADNCTTRAEAYTRQLEAISGVLKRNHMKVRGNAARR